MTTLEMFASKIDELMWQKKTLEENLKFLTRNGLDSKYTIDKLLSVQNLIIEELKAGA
jgi:hypothetical protein